MNKEEFFPFYTSLLDVDINAKTALFMSFMICKFLRANKDWFLVTADEVCLNTGLTKAQQVPIKKQLFWLEILETERRGRPPRNWYKINMGKIHSYFPDFQFVLRII